ncbi:hypothetical protein ACWEYS_13560 [Staphylococcus xylosus]
MVIENRNQIKDLESVLVLMNETRFRLSMEVTKYNRGEGYNQFYILYLINDLKNLYRWANSYIDTREEFNNNKEIQNYSQLIIDLEEILQSDEFNEKFLDKEHHHVNDTSTMSKRLSQFEDRAK